MQRMVFAKEFAKNLHDGRISDEPSRLESAENKALQNLCYIVSQGDSLSWFIVLSSLCPVSMRLSQRTVNALSYFDCIVLHDH